MYGIRRVSPEVFKNIVLRKEYLGEKSYPLDVRVGDRWVRIYLCPGHGLVILPFYAPRQVEEYVMKKISGEPL